MKKCFLIASCISACFLPIRADESIDSVADIGKKAVVMEQRGQQCAGGSSKKLGVYIIAVSSMGKIPGMKAREVSELAILKGKKIISAFIGQEMTASEELKSDSGSESYKSYLKIDTNQLLKGVVLYDLKDTGKGYRIVCFTTGRTIDMAEELKKHIAAAPPGTVAATGVSYIEKNRLDQAKGQALQSALRLAVEQVLGTEVAASSHAQDDARIRSRIYANAFGFVEQYRIVDESVSGDCFRTTVYAKVSKDKLQKSYAAYMKSMGNPEFCLMTQNADLYQTFVSFFTGLGLKLTADLKSAVYVIDTASQFHDVVHPLSGRPGTQLSLRIRISDPATGQELLSQKNDPRRSTAFTGTPERRRETAVQKAFEQIRGPLHRSLNDMLNRMVLNGRDVVITVRNYRHELSDSLDYLSVTLENMPGLSVQNKKIEGGNVTFTASYRGRMDDLEYFLRNSLKNGLNRGQKVIPRTLTITVNQLCLTY